MPHSINPRFILPLIAAMSLAGCSDQETPSVTGTDDIAFRASEGQGRAATTLGDFHCSAWNQDDGNLFFENLLFQKDDDGIWRSTPTVHWAANGQTLAFFAWSPNAQVELANGVPQVKGFSHSAVIGQQADLLLAEAKGSKSTIGQSPVPLEFRHALTKIDVKALNTSVDYDVEVAGVGMLTMTNADASWPDDEGLLTWSAPSTSLAVATPTYGTAITVPAKTATMLRGADNSECFMLLTPFDLDAWNQVGQTHGDANNGGCYLSFQIKVTSKDDDSVIFPASGTYGTAWVPLDAAFSKKGGMAVDVTVDFTEGVGFWPAGTPREGQPILGQGVQVSVGASDWGNNLMQNIDASTI